MWTHLHVLGVRVGAVLEVGQAHVGGVLGKHLLPLQVVGGWGLEEQRKSMRLTLKLAVGCAADTGA